MDAEVIVVGAGPTGLLLASELALALAPAPAPGPMSGSRPRVRILERRTAPQPNSRALTLHPRSLELLDLRGLAPRFLAAGRTLSGWHFAALDTKLDFSALDSRHGHTLFLPQARTEALLEERARELGVEISRGYEVTALTPREEHVELAVTGPDGGTETLRAAYVAGCDGGRSRVRRAAGIGFPGVDETLTGTLGDFAVVGAGEAALAAAREKGVLVVPLGDGLTRFVCLDPERIRVPSGEPVTLEEFRTSLVRICGTDCGVAEPRWLSRFGNATRLADRYRAGRVLLAGDAAHIHFPAAGQGLNAGLQDAMNLGWKLAAELRGLAPAGLLDTYDAERRRAGHALTANTEVQTLLAELTLVEQYARPAAALRGMLDDLLGIPEVNARLAAQVAGLSTAYPTDAADPLAGRRMPDIALTTDDPAVARAHQLLHDGRFLLLDLTGVPRALDPVRDDTVRASAPTWHEAHPDLDGVTEVLVRPDGHLAWTTRTTDPEARRAARAAALTAWTGGPAPLERLPA